MKGLMELNETKTKHRTRDTMQQIRSQATLVISPRLLLNNTDTNTQNK